MPNLLFTVDDLVSEIRQQLDEQNRDTVSTEDDILPTINRANEYGFDTLARKYPEPLLAHVPMTLNSNQAEYDIPENVFEDRVQKIEIEIPGGSAPGATFREVQRISYRDITDYESISNISIPYYHCIFSRTIRFLPMPSGMYNVRLWYLKMPEKLMLPQGRITLLNTAQNYLILDTVGSSLTTESDALGSYVNIVDGQTGEIKGSLQIQSLTGEKVTFRSTPQRSTVLNRAITGDLSSVSVDPDDYLAPIDGTCVPYYGRPLSNFIIQFAVAEITRKLGGQASTEEQVLDKFEKQVERTWVKREETWRVKKRNQSWGVPVRKWWYYRQSSTTIR